MCQTQRGYRREWSARMGSESAMARSHKNSSQGSAEDTSRWKSSERLESLKVKAQGEASPCHQSELERKTS
eukprot:6409250-Amphidinium_carterae.3